MQQPMTRKNFIGAALAAAACGRGMAALPSSNGKRWYRGMLHMHTPRLTIRISHRNIS